MAKYKPEELKWIVKGEVYKDPDYCSRGGWCCLNYAHIGGLRINKTDLSRWESELRNDILQRVSGPEEGEVRSIIGDPVWRNTPNFWAKQYFLFCPFVQFDDQVGTCTIHDTKPEFCRTFACARSGTKTNPLNCRRHCKELVQRFWVSYLRTITKEPQKKFPNQIAQNINTHIPGGNSLQEDEM